MHMFTPVAGGSDESLLPRRMKSFALSIFTVAFVTSTPALAEIRPNDCARAAKYFDQTRGVSMLVMQNGHIVFEHYANGGIREGRWPIFSGTKNFWGLAALCAVRDGL